MPAIDHHFVSLFFKSHAKDLSDGLYFKLQKAIAAYPGGKIAYFLRHKPSMGKIISGQLYTENYNAMQTIYKFQLLFLFCLSTPSLVGQLLPPIDYATQHIEVQYASWGLTAADISELTVRDQYQSRHNGLTHIYFQQTHQGIEIHNAILNVSVLPNGKILYTGQRFVADAAGAVNAETPVLNAQEALQKALQLLDLQANLRPITSEETHVVFAGDHLSQYDIPVQLKYLPTTKKQLQLVWMIDIWPLGTSDYWTVSIDALNGAEVRRTNNTIYCRFGDSPAHQHSAGCLGSEEANRRLPAPPPVTGDDAAYRVFPLPVESPLHGDQALVVNPANPDASPLGWHDDGTEQYSFTKGNNVWAFPDGDADGTSDYDIDGGPTLNFDWPYLEDQEPQTQQEASITNLFYLSNIMHDIFYLYGFDEEAGNYQQNNFGNEGEEGDPVFAQGSFGGDDPYGYDELNNAQFTPSVDGQPGSMRMYLWNTGARLVEVTEPANIAGLYSAGIAEYGPSVQDMPVSGPLVQVQDDILDPYYTDGCNPPFSNAAELEGAIAMIDRGGCLFEEKTVNAEAAGAIGVIICNFEDGVITLGGNAGVPNPGIPSVSMRSSDCEILRQMLDEGVMITLAEPSDAGPEFLTGDFDNVVIAHEYVHGISNRLTGGPNTSSCLPISTDIGEQMGEGWSDFLAIALTVEEGDNPGDPRGIATYLRRELPIAKGLRPYPYSTDMDINPLTYGDIVSLSVPHGVGTVWASMLWDLYWAFVEEYGWSDDLYYGDAGNNRAIQLVMDAMKIQPCEPGFVDGRDAILAADVALYGGANQCLIWEVFARRGLGYYADQGVTWDNRDGTEDFNPLPTCIPELKITKTVEDFIDAGDDFDIELYIVNHKPEPVTNVIVTEELPEGLTYVPGSATMEPTINGSILSWDLGTLDFEEEVTIEFEVESALNFFSIRHFYEDFEMLNLPNWGTSFIGIEAPNYWTNTNLFSYSGDRSYFVEDITQESHQVLQTIVPEPVLGSEPALRFYHRYDTEPGTDAGLVEVSSDFGTTWNSLGDRMFLNPYDGQVDYNTFVVPNIEGFWGNSGGWIATYIDLSDFAGEEILIRFRFGTNNSVGYLGWFVDDVELMDVFSYNSEACVTSAEGDEVCAFAPGRGTIVESQIASDVNEALAEQMNLRIYPNPATNELNIRLETTEAADVRVELITIDGRSVYQSNWNGYGVSFLTIPTEEMVGGLYFVRVVVNGQATLQKVVIQ
jgi:extracellular elastinolytic metalloproteinase